MTITHLQSWRVDSVDEFPKHILDWAKAEGPMWLKPPQSVEEVRALQKGEDGMGWSESLFYRLKDTVRFPPLRWFLKLSS